MSSAVDFRRFRTWDAEPAIVATPAWRILLRYGYVRLASSWGGRTLLILLTIVVATSVGGISYAFAGGLGVDASAWSGAFWFYAFPLGAILLLVGAPLFADDLRFNAPLFYFSKPVRVSDYFAGKIAYLGSLVSASVLAPILALMVLALLVGVPVGHPPDYAGYYQYSNQDPGFVERDIANWHATHIDSVGEWLAAVVATLPGMLLSIAMFGSLAIACSVYTRRGWHAGMAFVALVAGTGIAGSVLSDSIEGAASGLTSPMGWAYLVIAMPLRLMFHRTTISAYEETATRGAGYAIPAAYVLLAAVTALALWASYTRLLRQEARL